MTSSLLVPRNRPDPAVRTWVHFKTPWLLHWSVVKRVSTLVRLLWASNLKSCDDSSWQAYIWLWSDVILNADFPTLRFIVFIFSTVRSLQLHLYFSAPGWTRREPSVVKSIRCGLRRGRFRADGTLLCLFPLGFGFVLQILMMNNECVQIKRIPRFCDERRADWCLLASKNVNLDDVISLLTSFDIFPVPGRVRTEPARSLKVSTLACLFDPYRRVIHDDEVLYLVYGWWTDRNEEVLMD